MAPVGLFVFACFTSHTKAVVDGRVAGMLAQRARARAIHILVCPRHARHARRAVGPRVPHVAGTVGDVAAPGSRGGMGGAGAARRLRCLARFGTILSHRAQEACAGAVEILVPTALTSSALVPTRACIAQIARAIGHVVAAVGRIRVDRARAARGVRHSCNFGGKRASTT